MAGRSVQEILAPQVILKTISRFNLAGTSLSRLFGWNVGSGPTNGAMMSEGNVNEGGSVTPRGNFDDYYARTGSYDIFDNTRLISSARMPGTPSARIKPQKVGNVQFTLPRVAETLELNDEQMHNRRPIGGPTSDLDRGGRRYIQHQMRYMAQRVANSIELQTAGMLRGAFYFHQSGDDLYQSLTSFAGATVIDYQIPAGHKAQLDWDGGGAIVSADWATAATDIPSQLYEINRAMISETGNGLSHVIVGSEVWNHVLNNTKVHAQGGSANVVFNTLSKTSPGEFTGVLRSLPWLTWHIVDYVLEVYDPNTSTTTIQRMVPADAAIFLPEVHSSWTTYLRGGEHVTEGPNGAKEFRQGFYPFSFPLHDPSGWALSCVHNGMPGLPVPKSIFFGTVTGF